MADNNNDDQQYNQDHYAIIPREPADRLVEDDINVDGQAEVEPQDNNEELPLPILPPRINFNPDPFIDYGEDDVWGAAADANANADQEAEAVAGAGAGAGPQNNPENDQEGGNTKSKAKSNKRKSKAKSNKRKSKAKSNKRKSKSKSNKRKSKSIKLYKKKRTSVCKTRK